MAPQGSEYQQFAQEQIDAANERYAAENGGQAGGSAPSTTAVPPGYEDVFPVTIEYKIDGWTYARTFYGGPLATAYKDVENAPPGYAQLRVDWDGDSVDESGEISLDEGRNAPGTDDVANVRWLMIYNSSVTWDASQTREIISPDGCGYERLAEPQYHACASGSGIVDSTQDDPEADVDTVLADFSEVDAIRLGVVFDQVWTNKEAECLVNVYPDGSTQIVDEDGGFIGADQGSSCVNVYQGEPNN